MQLPLLEVVRSVANGKPKGGDRLLQLLDRAAETRSLGLFVPWAAPPNGRTTLGREYETLGWIAAVAEKLGSLATVSTTFMPADSYAARNNFDMARASAYWETAMEAARNVVGGAVRVLPASAIEADPRYEAYMARQSYAFERLLEPQRAKVMASAAKYAGAVSREAAYESAADYVMRRAAEADWVSAELGTLWISLNYPERDCMCGDTPRVYAPEQVRTPWLKEAV